MVGSPWCWSENIDGCFEREGLVCMKSTPGDGGLGYRLQVTCGKYGW